MDAQSRIAARSDFWARVPLTTRITFFSAVFFLFAPLGILGISSFAQKRSWSSTAVFMAFAGLTAVGFAYSFSRDRRFLRIVVPCQFLWPFLPHWFPLRGEISVEGVGCVISIVASYALFIRFIAGQGARSYRLETEMRLAQQIHASLIPPVALTTDRLELFGRSLPSNEMGGDLLDVVVSGDRVDVCIADVSGHGVSAGVVMGMVKSAMRMKLRTPHEVEELLFDLNQVVCELAGPGMFVTCAILRFDGPRLIFCGAGHGPLIHFEMASGSLKNLESEHLPLGVLAEEPYHGQRLHFSAGDVFLLMTDGLTEVFDAKGRLLGQDAIESELVRTASRPLSEIYASLMEIVERHGPRTDDQTLLLVRVGEPKNESPSRIG